MTWEIICDNCGKEIPEGCRHVERADGKCFCNDRCEGEYDIRLRVSQDEWLNELETNVLSHYGVKQRVRVAKASTDIFHGEKKIVTDRCRHCPMLEERYAPNTKTYYVCTHPDTDGWEIEHLDLIPLWCTLEDN